MKKDAIKIFLKENGIILEDFLNIPDDMKISRKAFDGHMKTIENGSETSKEISTLSLRWQYFYKDKLNKYLNIKGNKFININVNKIFDQ
tara:strand:+ start:103 stop:369 length:267 start_codon:yes stop_codon:yes gene_type:complete